MALIVDCLRYELDNRPSFEELLERIQQMRGETMQDDALWEGVPIKGGTSLDVDQIFKPNPEVPARDNEGPIVGDGDSQVPRQTSVSEEEAEDQAEDEAIDEEQDEELDEELDEEQDEEQDEAEPISKKKPKIMLRLR